jgi:2-polyprenyl-6-methoxyphenol hydroxylase-like FAD-dependent oxidoreductase
VQDPAAGLGPTNDGVGRAAVGDVVGGGVGGLAAAIGLRRIGWAVTVLEQAPELCAVGSGWVHTAAPAEDACVVWCYAMLTRVRYFLHVIGTS